MAARKTASPAHKPAHAPRAKKLPAKSAAAVTSERATELLRDIRVKNDALTIRLNDLLQRIG